MGKKQTAANQLPNQIYGRMEEDTDGTFFFTGDRDYKHFDDGDKVGVYELVRIAQVRIGCTLENI